MARIEWDESFSVHNAEIDDQHKKWIAIYNKIHDCLTAENPQSLATLAADSLNAMHDYARNHFKFEEEYMAKLNYPDLVGHRRLHRDFENQVYSHIREIETGKILLNTSLLKIIRNWLVTHILSEDKKYSDYAHGADSPTD